MNDSGLLGHAQQLPQSAWGHAGRHYASAVDARHTPRRPGEGEGRHLESALEAAQPGVHDVVERAYKQWNTILRDYLRTETALRLTVGDDVRAVPVHVVSGVPPAFAYVMDQLGGLEWLLMNRPAIEAAAAGTRFMARHSDEVRGWWKEKAGPSDREEITRVQQTAEAWIRQLDETKAVDQIVGIEEDVLGAYYFRIPEIRLYWVVIGITARILGISPEALTVVVLAHELTHAYTHLGQDIDGLRWDTEKFAATDLHVVEGLAQFYTGVLCKRLEPRMPTAFAAYERLLAKQGGPYKAHLAWISDQKQDGEIVRVSMIECRSQGTSKGQDFTEAVKRYRAGIRGGRRA